MALLEEMKVRFENVYYIEQPLSISKIQFQVKLLYKQLKRINRHLA